MKRRIIALAAAAVFGLSSAATVHAVATPTPAPTTSTPTEASSPAPTETGKWEYPQATFQGRTVTITNVKPGWKVSVAVLPGGEGPQVASFSAIAQRSGSATIQLTGFPAGTYDIWVSAGDIPANESFYPKRRFGPESAPKPTPTKGGANGLAKTGV